MYFMTTECNCNNHSVDCAYSDALQSSNCTSCTQNTTGNNCELCLPGFYHDPLLPLSDPNTCKRKFAWWHQILLDRVGFKPLFFTWII